MEIIFDTVKQDLKDYQLLVMSLLRGYKPRYDKELCEMQDGDKYQVKDRRTFPDTFRVIYAIDLFKKEHPDTHRKYLNHVWNGYCILSRTINDKDREEREEAVEYLITDVSRDIRFITEYLEDLLYAENDIPEQPQEERQLTPTEKILIVHYLKIAQLKTFGYKEDQYFLSNLLGINPVSLKNPLGKLNDYTTNQLTEKQAQNIIPTLESVKKFFDNSGMKDESTLIETRVKNLKVNLGKD